MCAHVSSDVGSDVASFTLQKQSAGLLHFQGRSFPLRFSFCDLHQGLVRSLQILCFLGAALKVVQNCFGQAEYGIRKAGLAPDLCQWLESCVFCGAHKEQRIRLVCDCKMCASPEGEPDIYRKWLDTLCIQSLTSFCSPLPLIRADVGNSRFWDNLVCNCITGLSRRGIGWSPVWSDQHACICSISPTTWDSTRSMLCYRTLERHNGHHANPVLAVASPRDLQQGTLS